MNRVVTMRQVEQLSGMSKWRVLRHLKRLNEQVHGMLLVNTGTTKKPCWTVSLEALKRAAPGWFGDIDELRTRLAAVEGRIDDLEVTTEVHGKVLKKTSVPRLKAGAAA